MQPDYSPLVDAVWSQTLAILPYLIFAGAFVIALKVLGEELQPKEAWAVAAQRWSRLELSWREGAALRA